MSRRASLPGASELFRRTSDPVLPVPAEEDVLETASSAAGDHPSPDPGADPGKDPAGSATGSRDGRSKDGGAAGTGDGDPERTKAGGTRRGSGRRKHDAKITVYVSGDELLAMEHARLALRGSHELVVDRGRIVREAVAVVLADFEEHGADSVLVRRLRTADADAEHGSGGAEAAD